MNKKRSEIFYFFFSLKEKKHYWEWMTNGNFKSLKQTGKINAYIFSNIYIFHKYNLLILRKIFH